MRTANAATLERARLPLDAELAANDAQVPCRGPRRDLWTSDDRDERDYAAKMCRPCPALSACANYADAIRVKFHVWAGVDRGPKVVAQ